MKSAESLWAPKRHASLYQIFELFKGYYTCAGGFLRVHSIKARGGLLLHPLLGSHLAQQGVQLTLMTVFQCLGCAESIFSLRTFVSRNHIPNMHVVKCMQAPTYWGDYEESMSLNNCQQQNLKPFHLSLLMSHWSALRLYMLKMSNLRRQLRKNTRDELCTGMLI